MHHDFLDRFAHLRSPIHSLDPRSKTLAVGIFLLAVVTTPFAAPWGATATQFGGYLALLCVPILLSRVPLSYILRRSLVVIPFVLFVVIFLPFVEGGRRLVELPLGLAIHGEGLRRCAEVLAKAMTSVLALLLLASTTRFSRLLQGLEGLRFPRGLILILSFLYRYIFVLVDEAHRTRRAVEARSAGRRPVQGLRVYGAILGMLFLRAFERAERIYVAMVSRGFRGQVRPIRRLEWGTPDSVFLGAAAITVTALVIWGYGR